MTGKTAAEVGYQALIKALEKIPGVTLPSEDDRKKGKFGSNGAKFKNRIFVMLVRGRLVVKIPKSRVNELVAKGEGKCFDPRHDGRLMKEWLVLDPASKFDWLALSKEAMEFVASEK